MRSILRLLFGLLAADFMRASDGVVKPKFPDEREGPIRSHCEVLCPCRNNLMLFVAES